jgi:hypothetical protein
MPKKYEYVWVTRDGKGIYADDVEIWAPGSAPDKTDERYGSKTGAHLHSVCVESFERVFHWVPEKGERYKMQIYFDAVEA